MISRLAPPALLAIAMLSGAPLHAQDSFPSRPVRLIVPFPAGGAADFLARVVGERMALSLKQPVQVENRPGAGGNIGTVAALQGEHDGHTLMLNGVNMAVNRYLFRTLPFDADRDFDPVAMLAAVPNLMIVPNTLPVSTVKEFVAYAKANPGKVNYASIGNGTSLHLAGAQFNRAAGLDLQHVPYRETSAANTDLMAGRVEVMFQTISAAAGMVRGGKAKALAVTSAQRAPAFGDIPTLQEAGVDLATAGWFGLFVPAGTPAAHRARLEKEALAALRDPAVAQRISESGSLPSPLPGEAFKRFIKQESERLGDVIRKAGIEAG